MKEVKRIESAVIQEAIKYVVEAIARRHTETEKLVVVAIADGGIPFAHTLVQRLAQYLGREIAFGSVNISFHRDDIRRNPIPKTSHPTDLPLNIEGSTVILADDVLFTGRSVRAAINEIFDQGRPARVELAVLCDRCCRRLPIQADYLGFTETTSPDQRVVVTMDVDNHAADTLTIYSL